MPREPVGDDFRNSDKLECGLTIDMLSSGISFVYRTLDTIDAKLIESGSARMSSLVELANLSSIIGNLLATGIVQASNNVFTRAGAHKYQDLRATAGEMNNIEIKMALETNNPKGHLPKVGHYLTCRYVLGQENGTCVPGVRGDVVWIWELRFGHLDAGHFNTSNTTGDSGKTAVVNQSGMRALSLIYLNQPICPFSARSKYVKAHFRVVQE